MNNSPINERSDPVVGPDVINKNTTDIALRCSTGSVELCRYKHHLRRSFDGVTGINFRFRRLVTWLSPHGRGASSHIIFFSRYLYPVQSY